MSSTIKQEFIILSSYESYELFSKGKYFLSACIIYRIGNNNSGFLSRGL